MRKFFFIRHNTFAVWIEQPPTNFLSSLNSEGGTSQFWCKSLPKSFEAKCFSGPSFQGEKNRGET